MSRGYLLFALDTKTTDYSAMAYACALSIKLTQPGGYSNVSVVTDTPDRFKGFMPVFDNVIEYAGPKGMDARSRAYAFTPYTETVLLDSDMLFVRPLDHLWECMKNENLYISTTPQSYRGRTFKYGPYRTVFEKYRWQDVYNAWTYFKKSEQAKEFFDLVIEITDNPKPFINEFIPDSNLETMPTDEAFALALDILDINLPNWDFPRITHMKPKVQYWNTKWYEQWNYHWQESVTDWDYKLRFLMDMDGHVTLGVWPQTELLHYVKKDLMVDYYIKRLEAALCRIST